MIDEQFWRNEFPTQPNSPQESWIKSHLERLQSRVRILSQGLLQINAIIDLKQVVDLVSSLNIDLDTEGQILTNAFNLFNEVVTCPGINALSKTDMQRLLHTCFLLTVKANYRFVMTVGFGGSDHGVITRVPSYIIPGLQILTIFKRHYVAGHIRSMPQLRIVNASHIAATINTNFDRKKLLQEGQRREQFFRYFVEAFGGVPDCDKKQNDWLDLRPHILIESDEEIDYFDQETANAIFEKARFGTTELNAMQDLRKAAAKRVVGDERAQESAMRRYAAGHLQVFGEANTEHIPRSLQNADDIMSLGGKSERDFNALRATLSIAYGQGEVAQRSKRVIHATGDVFPPYYQTPHDTVLHPNLTVVPMPPTDDSHAGKSVAKDFKWQRDFFDVHATAIGKPVAEVIQDFFRMSAAQLFA